MGGARAQFRVKKCLQCSAEPRDPDTDPGALARRRTACSSAAELCALQRSLQQSSAAAAATCSTEKEERARDLLQTFPRAAAWFPKRGAHTPEPLAAAECSRAGCARRAEQSAEPGGCTSGRSSSRAALLLLLSNPCHNHDSRLPCHSPQKGGGTATKWADKLFSSKRISSALANFKLSSQSDRLLKEGHFDNLLPSTTQSHLAEDPFLSQEHPLPQWSPPPSLGSHLLCSLCQCLMQPSPSLTFPQSKITSAILSSLSCA